VRVRTEEDEHKVEEIYRIPYINKWVDGSSQQDVNTSFEGLQSEESKDLG
jgi:hypothetical protein